MEMSDRLADFWRQQGEWSQATFGPDIERGPIGPLKHLAKEVQECLADPWNMEEKIDCLFLVIDAARRSGASYQQFMDAAFAKLEVNKAREWQQSKGDSEPVEHVRS
jgi:hypothetical protein